MAEFVDLQPGMRLMVPSPDGVSAGYYRSTVRRIDRRGLLVDVPRLNGEDLPLTAGQSIVMFAQVHGRMYEFKSRVREVQFQLLLDEPAEAKRTERRAFFRLLVSIRGRLTVLGAEDEAGEDEAAEIAREPMDVSVVDLSGGGARVRSEIQFPDGTALALELWIDGEPLLLAATVVRTSEIELARGGARFEAHCMFTDVRAADQDRIVRFVFQKQREFSQRGVA